jgi:hypothetical protein
LIGFDYWVEYRPGTSNIMVDALSHRDADEGATTAALSVSTFHLFDTLWQELATTPALKQLKKEVADRTKSEAWWLVDDLVTENGKVLVASKSLSLQELLESVHRHGHERL